MRHAVLTITLFLVVSGIAVIRHGAAPRQFAQAKPPKAAERNVDFKALNPPRKRKPRPREMVFVEGTPVLKNGGFEKGKELWALDSGHTLIESAKAAHSGTRCVKGQLDAPRKALYLRQKLRVTEGAIYSYSIWARATKGVKMTVFIIPEIGTNKGRKSVGVFQNIPARWRRFEGRFTAPRTGDLELQFITPSTFASAPGTIWVDDAQVSEFQTVPPIPVTQGKGFNDQPTMVRSADGSLFIAWVSFADGDDTLRLGRYRVMAGALEQLGEWDVVSGKDSFVFAPQLVADGQSIWLVYAGEVSRNWDVYAVKCGAAGPGRPIRVSRDAGVDTDPCAAVAGDRLWVAWESSRDGERQVMANSLTGTTLGNESRLSAAGVNCYDPTIAVLDSGRVAAAWHGLKDNNVDLFLRSTDSGKVWKQERRLTTAATIDRHGKLFARGDELWIAYENAQMANFSIGGTRAKNMCVARIEADGLKSPAADGMAPMTRGGEALSPAFDEQGRLWLAFTRGSNRDWFAMLSCHNGAKWVRTTPVATLKGMDRAPSVVFAGDEVTMLFQADTLKGKYNNREESAKATSDLYLAVTNAGELPAATQMVLAPHKENAAVFEPATLRVQYGEDRPTPHIQYKGQTLKLFYGDLHDHTQVSICGRIRDESIDESYQNMRDLARHDFACVTDHGYGITPYLWDYTAKLNRLNNDPERFLTFLGEEWTSTFEKYSEKYPFGFYGHRNLVFADAYFPRWWNAANYQTPAEVWSELRQMNANFVNIPHQIADTGNVPCDWDFADETAQPVAEIFQGRGSYEYLGAPRMAGRSVKTKGSFIQDAWARGVVIGVIASPDHTGGRGKACVYAPELTREAVLDAIRARHCFGSTAAKIMLDVRVNGALMGEKIPESGGKPVEIRIVADCPGDIDRIEVCRNNEFIYSKSPKGKKADLVFRDTSPVVGKSYYYVRLIQTDEEIAWSSPVWLGY
ncbi:MAG: CehA/McbA family metallohydrolase [Lentisphaerae bacterium]|jgi:hypothetical protein|nr:CehA/McbA family metallohydrolase [Lentisphaerota bacterium]MBT4816256.1 CehA/McbA family metallohydrolase [Lentisphaerota bacterium]MBT5613197.1 CehA/McbA family metallohydrolase [Lentisphaerota bacterium]MBT7062140.1 CehA/McbA family metallohydrolase [Lentisphaerota bacterium]MBT7847652.1 CehA/McbA family metallohydrolase [Lentisphaerota bacterium]